MSLLTTLLAWLLLVCPWSGKSEVDAGRDLLPAPLAAALTTAHPAIIPALADLAGSLDLLDPRERPYLMALHRPDDFAGDLRILRRRYRELADAPPLHDHMRFPDRALINDLLMLNRQYRTHLERWQEADPLNAWVYREAIYEVDRLYALWDTIRDTQCEYYYVTVRRAALARVRDLLGVGPDGESGYYSGALPAVVPIERFREIGR